MNNSDYKSINDNLNYKAKILDWLFSVKKESKIINKELESEIKNKIIEKYNDNINFKKFADFIFCYDNNNVVENLVFSSLYHLNKQH